MWEGQCGRACNTPPSEIDTNNLEYGIIIMQYVLNAQIEMQINIYVVPKANSHLFAQLNSQKCETLL